MNRRGFLTTFLQSAGLFVCAPQIITAGLNLKRIKTDVQIVHSGEPIMLYSGPFFTQGKLIDTIYKINKDGSIDLTYCRELQKGDEVKSLIPKLEALSPLRMLKMRGFSLCGDWNI